jgi:GH25 family lysozyme M1 (1,4-beta-N-acetylmuramidase)
MPCQTYNYSANNVADAIASARAAGVDAPMWWLDVEVFNRWSVNSALNTLTVHAAAETLQKAGIRVGIYSTPLMWRIITGGAQLDLPVWVAGAPDDASAPGWCNADDKNFTGGGIWLVQSLPTQFDVDYACEPLLFAPRSAFRFDN